MARTRRGCLQGEFKLTAWRLQHIAHAQLHVTDLCAKDYDKFPKSGALSGTILKMSNRSVDYDKQGFTEAFDHGYLRLQELIC